jgi:two-component system, NarL family, invasion response regulator UvrY
VWLGGGRKFETIGRVTPDSPFECLRELALSPDIDHELALSRLADETVAVDVLTAREFEVLRLLLAERTTEEIGDTLHISPKTVANLHYLIKSKLGVSSDIELVRLALRQGMLAQTQ